MILNKFFKNISKCILIPAVLILVLCASGCGQASLTVNDLTTSAISTESTSTEETAQETTTAVEEQSETTSDTTKADTSETEQSSADPESAETQPAQVQPETQPAEAHPAETQPAQVQPETQPAEAHPAETQPAQVQPETQPAEAHPAETQPAQVQPETQPVETQPIETEPPAPSTFSCSFTVDAGGDIGTLYSGSMTFTEGTSIYDLLVQTGLDLTVKGNYISAINGLKEKEHGPMSGWLYQVNGVTPMKAANANYPADGDNIYWFYQYDE